MPFNARQGAMRDFIQADILRRWAVPEPTRDQRAKEILICRFLVVDF